jgi:hypothetical protein
MKPYSGKPSGPPKINYAGPKTDFRANAKKEIAEQ